MVDPGEGSRNGAYSLWRQEGQRFLQRHAMVSETGSARCKRLPTALDFSVAMRAYVHAGEKKTSCAKTPLSSRLGIGTTRTGVRAERQRRTTIKEHPVNESTDQLLCALVQGSRTVSTPPASAEEPFIRGTKTNSLQSTTAVKNGSHGAHKICAHWRTGCECLWQVSARFSKVAGTLSAAGLGVSGHRH